MKKYLLILTILSGHVFMAFSQENQSENKQQDIEALYVAYVTRQLEFTPEEAQKFWPVHAQFTNELKSIKKDLPELEKQQSRLDIKKRYQENFNKIIGVNRCERFFRMEGEFRKKLLDRINNDRRQTQRPRIRRGQ